MQMPGKGVAKILDREGNGALGNTDAAHEQCGDAHLTVGVIELVLGDKCSEATGDRGVTATATRKLYH